VVPGKVMAADVMRLKSATAVSGDSIAVTADNGIVRVDQARVTKTDVAAANGVIHVIDAVILPKGL
jgi:transforming growth factor-beta-induced protein